MAKRAHPSPSAEGSSRKKARREPEAEVPLQGASQPGLGSVESEKEEEVAPPLIQSRRDRGPATSVGIEVAEGPQSKAPLASLMTLDEGVEMQLGYPSTMMPALKVVESSLTIGPISGKASVAKASLVQVSSSSSKSDDHHIGHESAPHDASKSLHVAEEEMKVVPLETELSS